MFGNIRERGKTIREKGFGDISRKDPANRLAKALGEHPHGKMIKLDESAMKKLEIPRVIREIGETLNNITTFIETHPDTTKITIEHKLDDLYEKIKQTNVSPREQDRINILI